MGGPWRLLGRSEVQAQICRMRSSYLGHEAGRGGSRSRGAGHQGLEVEGASLGALQVPLAEVGRLEPRLWV